MAELYLNYPLFPGNLSVFMKIIFIQIIFIEIIFVTIILITGESESDQLYKICLILGVPDKNSWPDRFKLAKRLNIGFPTVNSTPLSSLLPNN